MYRSAMEQLNKWKQKTNKKPLIIRGARQAGKTWLMKEFGKTAYEKTVYINFDNNPQMKELFSLDTVSYTHLFLFCPAGCRCQLV